MFLNKIKYINLIFTFFCPLDTFSEKIRGVFTHFHKMQNKSLNMPIYRRFKDLSRFYAIVLVVIVVIVTIICVVIISVTIITAVIIAVVRLCVRRIIGRIINRIGICWLVV